ncbi:MAG: hypothetical protein LRY37_06300 [Alkalibacterium thalassium]|nr:hypothetical protein [Alkalibacterium thalassium]
MKKFLCPAMSIGFYVIYFIILQGVAVFLPDSLIVTLIMVASVFLFIPVAASHTSSRVMRRIRGISCRL